MNFPASAPVRLAVLSEQPGLNLVTFQDHPYQPSFLDTWTLLSWVAAQTERVQLAGTGNCRSESSARAMACPAGR